MLPLAGSSAVTPPVVLLFAAKATYATPPVTSIWDWSSCLMLHSWFPCAASSAYGPLPPAMTTLPPATITWPLSSLVVVRLQICLPVVALSASMTLPLVATYATFPACATEDTEAPALKCQATLPGVTFARVNAAGLPGPDPGRTCVATSQPTMPSPAVAAPASAASTRRRSIPATGAVSLACRPPAARGRTVGSPAGCHPAVAPSAGTCHVLAVTGAVRGASGAGDGGALRACEGQAAAACGACAASWSSRAR